MNSPLKTILWRTSIAVAIIAIIASFFYAEEDSRGRAAWQKVEQEINARGESLNWKDYIPPPVPDNQNFFKAPMMTEWFVHSTNATTPLYTSLSNPDTTTNFITEISASNYLAWCATLEPQFSQIRTALKRPAARIDGDYTDPFFEPVPAFANYRFVGQVLTHQAKCHLLLGEQDKALDDLTLLHELNLTLVKNGKPVVLVVAMMHAVLAGLYVDAVACGLDSHSWHDSQLADLQKQLGEINLLPVVAGSLRCQRAWHCRILDTLSMSEIIRGSAAPHSASDLGWWLMPNGWIAQNKAVLITLDEQVIGSFDLTNRMISPYKSKVAVMGRSQIFKHITPYNYFSVLLVPRFDKGAIAVGRNQTWVDQAQIACALERYRLANGKYPAALTDLVPKYLEKTPNDVITGTPMKYVRKDGQTFLLYSVGWNETDEGGITVRDRDGNEDRESGDWTWHYPSL